MNLFKRLTVLALIAVLALSLVACVGNGKTDLPSSSVEDTGSHREPYDAEADNKEFVDTDGDFDYKKVDWAGPEGYVIVVPAGNAEAKKTAAAIQDYYEAQKITLQIVTDNTAPKDKEILVGKTKRPESNKGLKENELEVSVKNGKLVFDGGHDVTVDSAVGKFLRLSPKKGKAYTFKVETDFSATTFLDGYEYVWGDEFEGTDINLSKWAFDAKMNAYVDADISYDRDVTNVEDGRLKLRGIRAFDPEREMLQFKMPVSVVTQHNMMFTYGYAEIRCKMPFFKGAWPSFWTQSNTGIGERKCLDYFVEVDVFEVFGSTKGEVVSTIHRWYNKNYYNYGQNHNVYEPDGSAKTHTSLSNEDEIWTAPDTDTINNEYHTYGWEWTPTVMNIYVDGQLVTKYDITKSFDLYNDTKGYHDPQFIIFNNHLTSKAAGKAGQYTVGYIDDNLDLLPSNYFIDYFRLYQKPGQGKIWIKDTPHSTYPDRK